MADPSDFDHDAPIEVWQRPPFAKGNTAHVTHGALSRRLVEETAREILASIEETAPGWLSMVDDAAIAAWVRAEARVQRLQSWCDEHGLIDSTGRPTKASQLLMESERLAARLRERLGFDPVARAQLARDGAQAHAVSQVALERQREAGADTAAARRLRGVPDGDAS